MDELNEQLYVCILLIKRLREIMYKQNVESFIFVKNVVSCTRKLLSYTVKLSTLSLQVFTNTKTNLPSFYQI